MLVQQQETEISYASCNVPTVVNLLIRNGAPARPCPARLRTSIMARRQSCLARRSQMLGRTAKWKARHLSALPGILDVSPSARISSRVCSPQTLPAPPWPITAASSSLLMSPSERCTPEPQQYLPQAYVRIREIFERRRSRLGRVGAARGSARSGRAAKRGSNRPASRVFASHPSRGHLCHLSLFSQASSCVPLALCVFFVNILCLRKKGRGRLGIKGSEMNREPARIVSKLWSDNCGKPNNYFRHPCGVSKLESGGSFR